MSKRGLDEDVVLPEAGGGEQTADANGAAAPTPDSSFSVRMMMMNNCVGTIIGKGGVNIKSIREQSACKVSIAELMPGAQERLVTMTGGTAGLNRAVELMLDLLDEQMSSDPAAAAAAGAGMEPAPVTHSFKLILSNNQVGGIIGKAGVTIKSMRDESGATIKVDPNVTMQGERIVMISGGKAAVSKAHQLTIEKLATMPEDAGPPQGKYQKTGGRGGGGVYGSAPAYQQQQQYGVPPLGYGAPPPGYGAPPPGYGSPQPPQPYAQGGFAQQYKQQYGGSPGYAQPPPPAAQFGLFGAPAQQQYAGMGQQAMGQQPYASPVQQQYVGQAMGGAQAGYAIDGGREQLVPLQMAGRLIGKGGAGIREMREMSGAQIKVHSECEPGTQDRKVTVTGQPEQVNYAMSLIAQKLAQGP